MIVIPILGAVSGDGLVQSLVYLLIIGICLGIVWFLGNYFISKLGGPPMASTIWTGLFVLLICLAAINFLLGLTGHPLVNFR